MINKLKLYSTKIRLNNEKIKNEITDMKDVVVFKSIEDAFIYIDSNDIIENSFIIGGAQLYNTCLEKYLKYIKSIYWSIINDKKYDW